MKPSRLCAVIALITLTLAPMRAGAWSWGAHKKINEAAVKLLPADMQAAVGHEAASIIAHAPDPDHWKDDPAERGRHYIDLELGDDNGFPFNDIPRDYADAVARYGMDSLAYMGTLPWRIDSYYTELVRSMREPTDSTWIRIAALAHYCADAIMPMHTTINYDGQVTGNRGIHFRFEWWMLEQRDDEVVLNPIAPFVVDNPLDLAWKLIRDAHTDIDTLLAADTDVRRTFRDPTPNPKDRHGRGADAEFDSALFDRLGEIAVRRMELAAEFAAGVWYAAWVEAGKPDLRGVPSPPPPPGE
jgi:hypothetical protein